MSPEGRICHDSAYPLSRIDTNFKLILNKFLSGKLTEEELIKRIKIIHEQNQKVRKYIDNFYPFNKRK